MYFAADNLRHKSHRALVAEQFSSISGAKMAGHSNRYTFENYGTIPATVIFDKTIKGHIAPKAKHDFTFSCDEAHSLIVMLGARKFDFSYGKSQASHHFTRVVR